MLTLKDVAERLAVSTKTAARIVRMEIPHYKVGGVIRLHEKDLDAYVKGCFRRPYL